MTGFKDRLLAPYHGLKVRWFDGWHPILDEALQDLPELDACSHELFRLLIQNPGPSRKRTALVTEHGIPVAVVGLRQKGRFSWEPVMQWIIPGQPFPAKSGYLTRAFETLNKEIWVAWWRSEIPPPLGALTRYVESTPTYRMHCQEDFEQYWRSNGYFKTIRRVRNLCKNFTIKINFAGSTDWIIKKWEEKWRGSSPFADPSLPDRLFAANYLKHRELYYTLSLFDQDVPIGGATMVVDGKDLVAGVLYNDPRYRKFGVGDRLIELSFSFAAEKGFRIFDIGGGHEYKKHWAKQDGERWWFHVCPEPLYLLKNGIQRAKEALGRAVNDLSQQPNVG